jgi:hypothetical protein
MHIFHAILQCQKSSFKLPSNGVSCTDEFVVVLKH